MIWGESVGSPDDLEPENISPVSYSMLATVPELRQVIQPLWDLLIKVPSWYFLLPDVGESGHKSDSSIDFTHYRKQYDF